MLIRRFLLLCLIALSLTVTGPLARGLTAGSPAEPLSINIAGPGLLSSQTSNIAASKHCQRGAMAWSSCSIDTGYPPASLQIRLTAFDSAFGRTLGTTADSLRASSIFRPPRLS